jgi:hypothetical protein
MDSAVRPLGTQVVTLRLLEEIKDQNIFFFSRLSQVYGAQNKRLEFWTARLRIS